MDYLRAVTAYAQNRRQSLRHRSGIACRDGGAVTGVLAKQNGSTVLYNAKNVIVARAGSVATPT
ncbi:MAG: hypothetical protein ACLSVD_14270 [Eggerthellaceae bacterium]